MITSSISEFIVYLLYLLYMPHIFLSLHVGIIVIVVLVPLCQAVFLPGKKFGGFLGIGGKVRVGDLGVWAPPRMPVANEGLVRKFPSLKMFHNPCGDWCRSIFLLFLHISWCRLSWYFLPAWEACLCFLANYLRNWFSLTSEDQVFAISIQRMMHLAADPWLPHPLLAATRIPKSLEAKCDIWQVDSSMFVCHWYGFLRSRVKAVSLNSIEFFTLLFVQYTCVCRFRKDHFWDPAS